MNSSDYVAMLVRAEKKSLRRQRLGPDEVFGWLKRAAIVSLLVGVGMLIAKVAR